MEKVLEEVSLLENILNDFNLIVWNDEVNDFAWVIQSLIEVCGHNPGQAEQCAMIIHSKGKYSVKKGEYDTLKVMSDALTDRNLTATIES